MTHAHRTSSPTSVGRRDVTEWRSPAGRRLADRHQRLVDRVGAHRALIGLLAVGGGVAAGATWLAATIYDDVADRNGIASLDQPALALAKRLRSPALDGTAAAIAHGFGPVGMPLLAAAAGGAFALEQRKAAPFTLLAAAGLGSLGVTVAGKRIIHRHRPGRRDAIPPYERSPSFPSGHTLNATTIAGIVAYLLMLRQRRQAPQVVVAGSALATIAGVGLSRVLLGAHWFTDVAVGWTTGAGWLATVITVHRLHLTTEHGRTPAATDIDGRR
ncbi:phosphatase PAP2 family protein [Curtobacterium sp. MCBD17_003]|uniref:phosphatase PAP2 family protein n=1 Tax=Curtobacterium sp. MCBD17_003 TaxID=2175667 RepID=UPI000DA7CA38|nr:phosphatase PAP2 family protein [Curtobacterium sp. MCBD17_003]WIE54445.1 phosphatase PAP2 family protein [Curtobacterium sp. MCBD17_003]